MRKFTLFLLLIMAMLPLQNVKADSSALDAYEASSNVHATWEGNVSNVVDGNKNSHWWTSQTQAVDDHITVEFQELANFGNIIVTFAESDFPTKAAIDISSNGTEWSNVAEFTEGDITSHQFACNANGTEAKYVRLRITETCGRWLKVKEIEVFRHASRTISAKTTTGGSVTINGGTDPVESTDKVTLIATPSNGYQFHYWKVGEEVVSYNYKHEDLSSGDIEYTAVFVEIPGMANNKYFIKSIGTDSYLTVKKYNVTNEEGSYKTEAKNGGDDQIFILEPAIEYNKYYIKSQSGYYLNCESWNAYAQNEKTTPILFDEIDTNVYTLYQTTSSHKAGYLNIQTNHENGLYCDADAANDNYKKWNLENYEVVDKSELQGLITEGEELLEKVAGHGIVEGDKINISGKITSNAAQNNEDGNSGATNDGKGIAGLTDDDVNTYFHSRWGGQAVNEDHYLQIDLGEDNSLSDFCFAYSVRKGNSDRETSPAPTRIEVRVSDNGSDFGEPIAVFTKDDNNLPLYEDHGATLWHSDVISADKDIRYIRLTVTESRGPGNTEWEGHKFFAMSALNIYSTKPSDEYSTVKEEYKNSLTIEDVTTATNALATAKEAIENSAATQNQVNEVVNMLDTALETLRAAISHTLAVTEAGWATLYLDFNAEIPDGVEAYYVDEINMRGNANMVKIENVIPAETGVIIKAAKNEYTFNYSNENVQAIENNMLRGTLEETLINKEAGCSYYILGNEDGVGFYNVIHNGDSNQFLNRANKAYLFIESADNTAAFYGFDWAGTTGIDEVKGENGEVKAIFDLTGRRVEEITAPGIYIVNGKKVLVK